MSSNIRSGRRSISTVFSRAYTTPLASTCIALQHSIRSGLFILTGGERCRSSVTTAAYSTASFGCSSAKCQTVSRISVYGLFSGSSAASVSTHSLLCSGVTHFLNRSRRRLSPPIRFAEAIRIKRAKSSICISVMVFPVLSLCVLISRTDAESSPVEVAKPFPITK